MERDINGEFVKGNAGRPKGSPNKVTAVIRKSLTELIEYNLSKVQEDIDQLKPRERVRVIVDLLQYAVPKYQAVQFTTDVDRLTDEQAEAILKQIIHQANER